MSESSIINHRSSIPKGFTLIESVAALAVASIALLALLQLQLVSMRAADQAAGLTRATLLAQEKTAELLSGKFPPVETKSGILEANGDRFAWQMDVTDARLPQPVITGPAQPLYRPPTDPTRLRQLRVDVNWEKGPGSRHVSFTTLMAENAVREDHAE
jgi:type II secretion system protein I